MAKKTWKICAGEKGFPLVKDDNGQVHLDRNHAYYFQVQVQIHTVDAADYCDFVMWNENNIIIERILADEDLWKTLIPKAERFFRQCLLPEILGMKYSNENPIVDHINKTLKEGIRI